MSKLSDGMKKKILIGCGVAVLGAGICFGGYKIYDSYHGGAVSVYSQDYITTSYWGDGAQSSGYVMTDKLQTVYISSSQKVKKVYVKKGQKVKAGDKLLAYDTTLTDLTLQRKKIELQKTEKQLADARKGLAILKSYRAGVPVKNPYNPDSYDADLDFSDDDSGFDDMASTSPVLQASNLLAQVDQEAISTDSLVFYTKDAPLTASAMDFKAENMKLLRGSGSKKSPYCYYWHSDYEFSDLLLKTALQGKKDAYIRFYLHDESSDSKKDETASDSKKNNMTTPEESKKHSGNQSGESQKGKEDNKKTEDSKEESSAAKESETISEADLEQYDSFTIHAQSTGSGYRYAVLDVTIDGTTKKISKDFSGSGGNGNNGNNNGNNGTHNGNGGGSEEPYVDPGVTFTAAELQKMVNQQLDSIRNLDITVRGLKLNLQKLEKEKNSNIVYAKMDGVVKNLIKTKKADENTPLMKISAGGGYYITSSVPELLLDTLTIGQEVSITNYEDGSTVTGTLSEISNYPTDRQYYYGEGNNNVSYYPIRVDVSEDADLEPYSYVDISLNGSTVSYDDMYGYTSDISYLMKSFILSENGKKYIYVDKDGRLEKREIQTGKVLWGEYYEIIEGLDKEEKLAFPYGKNIKENAPTKEGSIDELYAGM